jgi:hypothetical protein
VGTKIIAVTIDCRYAEALAAFWRQALGFPEPRRRTDDHGLTYVELKRQGETTLLFQPVGENKCNRDVTDTYASLP